MKKYRITNLKSVYYLLEGVEIETLKDSLEEDWVKLHLEVFTPEDISTIDTWFNVNELEVL